MKFIFSLSAINQFELKYTQKLSMKKLLELAQINVLSGGKKVGKLTRRPFMVQNVSLRNVGE